MPPVYGETSKAPAFASSQCQRPRNPSDYPNLGRTSPSTSGQGRFYQHIIAHQAILMWKIPAGPYRRISHSQEVCSGFSLAFLSLKAFIYMKSRRRTWFTAAVGSGAVVGFPACSKSAHSQVTLVTGL